MAWNPPDEKSSFAEPAEDILRLDPSRCSGSKRWLVSPAGLSPSFARSYGGQASNLEFRTLLLCALSYGDKKALAAVTPALASCVE